MSKKVLVLYASPINHENSDLLCEQHMLGQKKQAIKQIKNS